MTVFVKSNFEIFGENTGFPKKSLLFVPEDHNDQVRTNIKYNILNAKKNCQIKRCLNFQDILIRSEDI